MYILSKQKRNATHRLQLRMAWIRGRVIYCSTAGSFCMGRRTGSVCWITFQQCNYYFSAMRGLKSFFFFRFPPFETVTDLQPGCQPEHTASFSPSRSLHNKGLLRWQRQQCLKMSASCRPLLSFPLIRTTTPLPPICRTDLALQQYAEFNARTFTATSLGGIFHVAARVLLLVQRALHSPWTQQKVNGKLAFFSPAQGFHAPT